jgi:hypothetical protein
LLPGNPVFRGLRISRTPGNRSTIAASLPSVDALSTTTTSIRSAGQSSFPSASRHRTTSSPPL